MPYFLLWFVVRPVVKLDAFWVLGGWILVQFWQLSHHAQSDVPYMAHVGGFFADAAAFPVLRSPMVKLFECVRGSEETTSRP